MRYSQFSESNAPKDPNKLLALRIWSDGTFPIQSIAALGKLRFNNPADTAKLAEVWYEKLTAALKNCDTIDITQRPEFKGIVAWLATRYAAGDFAFEDLTTQAVDTIGFWLRLKGQPDINAMAGGSYITDLNSFSSYRHMAKYMDQSQFQAYKKKFKNAMAVERAKRDAKEIVLIDDEHFKVTIPLNYGACYLFNNEVGIQASYCTGSSSGFDWAKSYLRQGIIIQILDKQRADTANGKWQIHSASRQFFNAKQQREISRNNYSPEVYFGRTYPGLMQRIEDAILQNSETITAATGHDAAAELRRLKRYFVKAWGERSK